MMTKKFDVLVVGELNVDIILNQIDSFPEMGKEKLARQMSTVLGSSSAILASNISSLGARVAFAGKIGKDANGDLVIETLHQRGVNTDQVIRSAEVDTGATIVLNYAEDRAMVTYPGAMEQLTLDDISKESLAQAKHLHFSSYFLQPGLQSQIATLFRQAKELGLTTSMDPQWDPEEQWNFNLAEILPYVDVLLPNEKELLYLTRTSSLSDALEAVRPHAHWVVVKKGNEGSYLWHDGDLHHQPPFLNESVVDAIGAGDSFNAGFLYQFIQGKPLVECQTFGNLTGAISTTRAGGTAAFSSQKDIEAIAQSRFDYPVTL